MLWHISGDARMSRWTPLFMKEIFLTHIRPLLDFSSVVWNTGYLEDLYKLESGLRFWTRNVYGFGNFSYETRLRKLDIFSMAGPKCTEIKLILMPKLTISANSLNPHSLN